MISVVFVHGGVSRENFVQRHLFIFLHKQEMAAIRREIPFTSKAPVRQGIYR